MAVAAQQQDNGEENARSVFALAVYAQLHGGLQNCLLLDFCLVCKIGI